MKHFCTIGLIALLLIAVPALAQDDPLPGPVIETRALVVDDVERTYVLAVPDNYDQSQPLPLLVVLHGAGGNGTEMAEYAGLGDVPTQTGAIVAYPDAIDESWNYLFGEESIDDTGFIRALIDETVAEYAIDETRIYLAGYSNGGLMAVRLRCEMADTFAAVAALSATMTISLAQNCVDAEPLPFLLVLGDRDEMFPWNGHMRAQDGVVFGSFSVAQTMSYMASLNQCGPATATTDLTATRSIVRVIQQRLPDCANDAEVLLYALPEVPHVWPVPALVVLEAGGVGTIQDAIWAFFLAHSR
jgi:polyhydroxybutyrate depolymerase